MPPTAGAEEALAAAEKLYQDADALFKSMLANTNAAIAAAEDGCAYLLKLYY